MQNQVPFSTDSVASSPKRALKIESSEGQIPSVERDNSSKLLNFLCFKQTSSGKLHARSVVSRGLK